MKTISILGGGNMGCAISKALHKNYNITVKNEVKTDFLDEKMLKSFC